MNEPQEEKEVSKLEESKSNPVAQYNVKESIKEVDESENLDHTSSKLSPVNHREAEGQQKFIRDMVKRIWYKYDTDRSGMLDKIETANFLNEILTTQNMGPPSMEQFNMFFAEFDINNDGVIQ